MAGRAAAERLVYQDKVKYIICQFNSPPIVGALTVTQPNKVIQISDGMTEKTMEPQYGVLLPCAVDVLEQRPACVLRRVL